MIGDLLRGLEDGVDAREAVHHDRDESAIAQPDERGLSGFRVTAAPVFLATGMLSSNSRASSAVRTGVLPFLTTYLGPRTAWAGFTSMTWPTTSQSNSMRSADAA